MIENSETLLLSYPPPKTTRDKHKPLSIKDQNSNSININIYRTDRKSLSNSPMRPLRITSQFANTKDLNIYLRASQTKLSQTSIRLSKSLNATSNLSQLGVKKRSRLERNIEAFLDSTPVLILMSLFTVYALFSSDIQAAWLRKDVDLIFNIIPSCLMGIFGIEFILNCIAKRDYLFSFFFWLDLLATLSFIQDIDYIIDPILGYNHNQSNGANNKRGVQAAKAVAKVSSASRATRVLRIIRIIRLIRMIKLYKNVFIAREKAERARHESELKKELEIKSQLEQQPSDNISSEGSSKVLAPVKIAEFSSTRIPSNSNDLLQQEKNEKYPIANRKENKQSIVKRSGTSGNSSSEEKRELEEEEELLKESKISKLVNESITKKVIIIILILLIIIPLISEDFYANDSTITYSLVAQLIANSINLNRNFSLVELDGMQELFDENFPALNITNIDENYVLYENTSYTKDYFRYKETKIVYSNDGSIEIIYSILEETQMNGWLNVIQTIFVCFCLVIATMSFENQTDKLVLQPLEIMIEIVETVAKDPINAKNIETLQTGVKATVLSQSEENPENVYEIQVIKSAIIKISALLAIGFGEAGGEIIQKNLSSSSELNPRLKGKKKSAIFGFCDIRQFESITLALEEKTMVFVNEIAEIVHSSVDLFGGATNKNIGEAFLNVWKFYNDTVVKGSKCDVKKFKRRDNLLEIDPTNPQIAITADCAVWAFLRVILKINKRWNILEYRHNAEICKRITDFKLNMGFGLHMGYGIEGAVGSTYKIDASYLSPNVNIAARLESATRQFGVPILISGVVHKLFSPEMKSLCRFVDCVKVKGSTLPIELYTIDLNLNVSQQNKENILIMANKDKRQFYNDKKELFKRQIELIGNVTRLILEKNSYLEMLKTAKNDKFYQLWDEGISYYQKGNFRGAGERFKECLSIDINDGPAKTLLSYIQSCHYNAPDKWDGTRELLAK